MDRRTLLGALAGAVGGRADTALMRTIDIFLAFPGILLAIALVAPLPDAIQSMTAYHAAVTAASLEQAAARDLTRFLAAPEAKPVFAATGID